MAPLSHHQRSTDIFRYFCAEIKKNQDCMEAKEEEEERRKVVI